MAIVFTGSKTVTKDAAPHLTAASLTTLLAKAPETMTVADLHTLLDACNRGPVNPSSTVGTLLP
jgi:hypothetical protein